MSAGGPPKPMHPMRPHSRAMVASDSRGLLSPPRVSAEGVKEHIGMGSAWSTPVGRRALPSLVPAQTAC